jgi:ABC-type Fe3+ transport system permease subunit
VKTSISQPSPLSPTRWPADAFVWWRSLLFVGVIFLTLIVPAIVALELSAHGVIARNDLLTFSWASFIVQLVS